MSVNDMTMDALAFELRELEVDINFYMDYLPIADHTSEVEETQEMIDSLRTQHKQVVRELTKRQAMLAELTARD